jgi:hypothetical protein
MKTQNSNIKTVVIVAAVLLVLFLVKDWLKPKLIVALGGYTTKETTIVTDTIVGKSKIDTLAVFNGYVKTKGIILNPKPEIVYRYISPVNEMIVDSVKRFQVAVKDSLVNGNLSIINSFNGDLLNVDFIYYPLFPKYIRETIPNYITVTKTEYLSKDRSYIGIGAGIDTELTFIKW